MKNSKNIFSNALIRFGLDRRMNRVSTLVVLLISVLGIGGMMMLFYTVDVAIYGLNRNEMIEFGQIAFALVAGFHATLVLLLSVSSAAGEISGEKQRQTIDLLTCSQLTSGEIVWGKLFSSFSYTFLISIGMLPVYAVIYLFGGINAWAILLIYVLMLFFGAVLSSISLYFSACFRKSSAAVLMTILVIVIICGGNGMIEVIVDLICEILEESGVSPNMLYTYSYESVPWILQLNPVVFIVAAVYSVIAPDALQFSNGELVEYLITMIFTPVFSALLLFFSIQLTKRKLNPYKSNPRKG